MHAKLGIPTKKTKKTKKSMKKEYKKSLGDSRGSIK
jgi:hypothetical protein